MRLDEDYDSMWKWTEKDEKIANSNAQNNKSKMNMAKKLTYYYIPLIALTFVGGYWTLGLIKKNYPD